MHKIKEFDLREEMYYHVIPKNQIGAELGVCRGINASFLYRASRPSKMYLVDRWVKTTVDKSIRQIGPYFEDDYSAQVNDFFQEEIREKKVEIYKMGTIDFLKKTANGYLDWVYLDSSHFYNHISAEIKLSLVKVKKGGLIMGHDFHPGDKQKTGVIRAVIENCMDRKMVMVAISNERTPTWVCKVL